jgi:hypothetical protein
MNDIDPTAIKEFLVTREQFDRLQIAMVQVMFGCPEHLAPDAIEHSYPVSTSIAIDELRKRGLAANQYQTNQFLARHGELVTVVAKTRVWSKAAIDLFADELSAAGHYMSQAIERMREGKTAQEAVDEIAAQLDTKIAELKAAIAAHDERSHRTAENVIGQKKTFASN